MNLKVVMLTTAHRHDDVRICHKEAVALCAAGHRVEIVNPNYEGALENGPHFARLPLPDGRMGRLLCGQKRALELVKSLRPHICHIHDPELLPLIPRLGRLGILTVYDAHEDLPRSLPTRGWVLPPLRPAAGGIAKTLLNHYAPLADGLIAATDTIAKTLPGAVLVRNRVTEADCTRFDSAAAQSAPQPDCVCYAGAITAKRGAEMMIKACAAAGVRLLLAGEFESPSLRRRLEALPEYACVDYQGALDREGIAQLYARASAGLLLLEPTRAYRESEPIKLFEYLCAGLPVVACDFAHWQELADGGVTAWVDPVDKNAVAIAIQTLLADQTARREAAKRAPVLRERFGFGPEAQRLLALYDGLEARSR